MLRVSPVPIEHHVFGSQRLVITTCSGVVSRDELASSFKELRNHPDFHPDFRQLVDLSQVSKLDLGFRDMEAIHREDDPFSNEGRRAVVAPGQGAIFGLARMYQSLVDDEHFEVFQSVLDAITWLGVETMILTGKVRSSLKLKDSIGHPRKRGASG